jgi:hypothetical protein
MTFAIVPPILPQWVSERSSTTADDWQEKSAAAVSVLFQRPINPASVTVKQIYTEPVEDQRTNIYPDSELLVFFAGCRLNLSAPDVRSRFFLLTDKNFNSA